MKWKVLSLADISACPDVLDTLKPVAEVTALPASQETLLENISAYDAYFASLAVRMNKEVLDRAARLRVIATPTTGLDHIDVEEARARGIEVLCIKNDIEFLNQVTATAEMAWGLLLATVRRIPWAFQAACEGNWARDGFRGRQLSGKTLGILGYGRLGRMVAEYGKAFRMRVLACDSKPVDPAPGVTMVDFPTLLRESDVLSIHIHLTKENEGLLDRQALRRMKPGAVLLNTSRGAIIDETALAEALADGHLGGAGLDVIHGEWNPNLRDHQLIRYAATHQNLVIVPHLGGITYESQTMAYAFAIQKLKKFLEEIPA